MTRNQNNLNSSIPAFAALSVSWLLEDRAVVSPRLSEKLAVPGEALTPALASLTRSEREELKRDITEAAAHGSLPGPLRAWELCDFLDSLTAGPAHPANGLNGVLPNPRRGDSLNMTSRGSAYIT